MTKKSHETVYTIAKKAGVSASTVSRVMDGTGNVAPATASRVRTVIEAAGFQRNSLARNLSKNDSDTFAILLPDLTNPYFPVLVREIQKQSESVGFGILLCDTHNDIEVESKFLEKMISQQVKNVFIAGSTLSKEKLSSYLKVGLNFISVDRALPIPSDLVQSDNYVGACIAVEHLISLGHSEILHIQGPKGVSTSVERHAGYKDTMNKHKLQVQSTEIGNFDFSEEGGRQAFKKILQSKTKFSAIFSADDLIAIGVLFAAEENGYNVPKDFSLIGFDDIAISKYVKPRLTTIRQDIPAIAKELVAMAISSNTIRPKQKIVLPVSLEIRESTSKMKN
jgi:LacI family transcriptional regulator